MQAALRGPRWPTRAHGALRRGRDAPTPRREQVAVPPLAERLAVTARQLRGEGVPEAQITKVFVAPPPPWRPPAG